jgi:hypothetical protein
VLCLHSISKRRGVRLRHHARHDQKLPQCARRKAAPPPDARVPCETQPDADTGQGGALSCSTDAHDVGAPAMSMSLLTGHQQEGHGRESRNKEASCLLLCLGAGHCKAAGGVHPLGAGIRAWDGWDWGHAPGTEVVHLLSAPSWLRDAVRAARRDPQRTPKCGPCCRVPADDSRSTAESASRQLPLPLSWSSLRVPGLVP